MYKSCPVFSWWKAIGDASFVDPHSRRHTLRAQIDEDFKLSVGVFAFEERVHLSVKIFALRIWTIEHMVHGGIIIVANIKYHLRGRHAGKRVRVSAAASERRDGGNILLLTTGKNISNIPIIIDENRPQNERSKQGGQTKNEETDERIEKRHYYCDTRAHDDAWNVASMNEAHTS
jgi:hypothetical protein